MPVPPVLHRRSALLAAACAATACALVTASPAAAEDPVFTAAPDLTFAEDNAYPVSVAVGDFNSDGKQDLAIADSARNNVRIRLGNGDGTFTAAPSVPGMSQAVSVVVGDFDADGIEDLAVAARLLSNQDVAVLHGLGDGTFLQNDSVDMPSSLSSLAVGDFNGDGYEDFAGTTATQVTVRLRGTNGRWTTGVDLPLDAFPRSATAGDFDGDGIEDLAVILNAAPRAMAILPGKGDGSFGPMRKSSISSAGEDLAVGDFNGDGRQDLVAAINAESRVSVRLGNGDGTLDDDPPDVLVGTEPWAVAVGDFNSDGREDLAAAHGEFNAADAGVSIRLGNGDGTFTGGGEVRTGLASLAVAIGDFDANGKEDLAIASYVSHRASVRLGTGPSPLAGNLLINGGFEQGFGARLPSQSPAIPGWSVTGGMTFVRYGTLPHLIFPSWRDAQRYTSGGFNFLWGGDSTGLAGVTTASQSVDVSGSAEAIDSGRATANLSAYLGGAGVFGDSMRVAAEFLGADGSSLGSLQIGPVTDVDRHNVTTMMRRAGSGRLPVGTRTLRVVATSVDNDTVSSATADNLKLTLSIRDPDVVVNDTPPPPPPARFGSDTKVTVGLVARKVAARGPVRVRVTNGNEFVVPGTLTSKLATRPFSVAAGGRTTIKLALGRALRRRLVRKKTLAVRLSAVVTDPAGNRRTVPRRVVLRLKSAKHR